MTIPGPAHPLDVDLADLADGVLGPGPAAAVRAHVDGCLLCRLKVLRLADAPPPGPPAPGTVLPRPAFTVPPADGAAEPVAGDLWLAGAEERLLVLVVRVTGDQVLVAPVTLDTEAAGEATVVVDAARSPFRTGLAVHPALAAVVPRAALTGRLATLAGAEELADLLVGPGPGLTKGAAGAGATDPRAQVAQALADGLAALAPPSLLDDLRDLRGPDCAVRPLAAWDDLPLAEAAGWRPLATLDELGVVLVLLDTPHGLVDPEDFEAARSVLTRLNATALVVLARDLSEEAEVFDAASLHAGIDVPSGAHTPPRPLISGLEAFDAVAKYLDQHSGARVMSAPTRAPLAPVHVLNLLRKAAEDAAADAARQGARFKIAPKRRGYESLAGDTHFSIATALEQAFEGGSVVAGLLDLSRQ